MEPWIRVVALSLGGILGVNARYWLGLWMNRWVSAQFPWATLSINVSGSFAIGFLTMALARWLPHPNMRLLVIVGFLGGYTTFSTFAFESLTLWERGEIGLSLTNMIGSVAAGFVAVGLGVGLARTLTIPAAERAAKSDREIRAPNGVSSQQVARPAGPETDFHVDQRVESGTGEGEGSAAVEKLGRSS